MPRLPLLSLTCAIALSAGACDRQSAGEAQQQENSAAANTEELAGTLDRTHAGADLPQVTVVDPSGTKLNLAEASGKPMLLNLWATWCAPCVKELPTLDALSRQPGAPRVIAVSQDRGERPSIDAFLRAHKIEDVESWRDPKMALPGALNAQVLPTTIYYDASGREVWRYVGDLDWTGEEARKLLAELPDAGKD